MSYVTTTVGWRHPGLDQANSQVQLDAHLLAFRKSFQHWASSRQHSAADSYARFAAASLAAAARASQPAASSRQSCARSICILNNSVRVEDFQNGAPLFPLPNQRQSHPRRAPDSKNADSLGGTATLNSSRSLAKTIQLGTRPRITKQSRCFRRSSGNESQPDRLVGKVLARARQRAGFGLNAGKPLDHDFPHDFPRGHGHPLWAKLPPGGDWIAR
jgi:hypothetical protein